MLPKESSVEKVASPIPKDPIVDKIPPFHESPDVPMIDDDKAKTLVEDKANEDALIDSKEPEEKPKTTTAPIKKTRNRKGKVKKGKKVVVGK